MKRLSILLAAMLVISLFAGVLTACGEEKPDEPVVLKMASAAMMEYGEVEQAFADAFNARCGPDYTIEYYGAEQMLSFPELLDGVRTGAAEIGAVTPNFNSFDEPKLGAVELPFLLNNLDAHIYAVPKLKPLYGEILEEQFNQKLLCLHNYTGMALISTRPVKTMEDWDGLLVQAISPVIAAMVEALGGAPVTGQPYTESYSLMEKGTVDAVITAPAAMRIFALTDVASYMTSAYMVPALHGFSINLDAWNKLPGKIQDILVEEAEKQSDVIDEWLRGEWVKDFDAIAAAGVEIYEVPQAEIDRWKAACQPYFDQQMAVYGDFGKEVKKIADEANAKYPR
ncbi:MAG: TRAP transporter substrate-binding protein DctP [Dehalococcoidales bacterium]|nr:TRAP transporter substrate-binding protein DctP [Dehalococcoidales bacterium]